MLYCLRMRSLAHMQTYVQRISRESRGFGPKTIISASSGVSLRKPTPYRPSPRPASLAKSPPQIPRVFVNFRIPSGPIADLLAAQGPG